MMAATYKEIDFEAHIEAHLLASAYHACLREKPDRFS